LQKCFVSDKILKNIEDIKLNFYSTEWGDFNVIRIYKNNYNYERKDKKWGI
jgi:hypothetical protein